MGMTDKKAACQELSKVIGRMFDQPEPTINAMRKIMERHAVHPTDLRVGIGSFEEVAELQREVVELQAAVHRAFDTFEAACASKGYVGDTAMAEVVNTEPSRVKRWRDIGRVPAIFFHKLQQAPDRAEIKRQAAQHKATIREAMRAGREAQREEARKIAQEARRARQGRSTTSGEIDGSFLFHATPDADRQTVDCDALWLRFEGLTLTMHHKGMRHLTGNLIIGLLRSMLGHKINDKYSSMLADRFSQKYPDLKVFQSRKALRKEVSETESPGAVLIPDGVGLDVAAQAPVVSMAGSPGDDPLFHTRRRHAGDAA
jgi:hypothetical protein